MGLFNKNKIKFKKEVKQDKVNFFVDYYRLKEPAEFKLNFIRDIMAENHSFVVIDTTVIYKNENVTIEEEIDELVKLLEEQDIHYRKIVIKNDEDVTILGVKVRFNDAKKVKNYIVGFVVSREQLKKIEYIVNKFNAYYYMISNATDKNELLNKFNESRGDMEELEDMFEYNIFNNNFIRQITICSKSENIEFIDTVLKEVQKYKD